MTLHRVLAREALAAGLARPAVFATIGAIALGAHPGAHTVHGMEVAVEIVVARHGLVADVALVNLLGRST
jgi:hypothetical protein